VLLTESLELVCSRLFMLQIIGAARRKSWLMSHTVATYVQTHCDVAALQDLHAFWGRCCHTGAVPLLPRPVVEPLALHKVLGLMCSVS
jgi:hypothetical protein